MLKTETTFASLDVLGRNLHQVADRFERDKRHSVADGRLRDIETRSDLADLQKHRERDDGVLEPLLTTVVKGVEDRPVRRLITLDLETRFERSERYTLTTGGFRSHGVYSINSGNSKVLLTSSRRTHTFVVFRKLKRRDLELGINFGGNWGEFGIYSGCACSPRTTLVTNHREQRFKDATFPSDPSAW